MEDSDILDEIKADDESDNEDNEWFKEIGTDEEKEMVEGTENSFFID